MACNLGANVFRSVAEHRSRAASGRLFVVNSGTTASSHPWPTAVGGHHRPARYGRRALRVAALGFDFGDDERSARLAPDPPRPSPKAFQAYGLRASSLLLYQAIFKGAVGEALLALLSTAARYQASNKDILAAYGKFYNLLMLAGYADFSEYVLDQVLLGRDNSFARAVAQGQVAPRAPVLQAAAYDLDTLQGLALSLDALAAYVAEVAPTAGEYWASAASATALRPPPGRALGAGDGAGAAAGAPEEALMLASAGGGATGSSAADGAGFIGPPPSYAELAAWRALLAGHDAWSAALPRLQQYYLRHGFGVTSRSAALRWSKGGFEEAAEGALAAALPHPDAPPSAVAAPPAAAVLARGSAAVTAGAGTGVPRRRLPAPLSCQAAAFSALAANTRRHCAGLPAQHAVVAGPPGAGRSWLLWEGALLAARDEGVRLVDVPASELPNLLDIARGCARYPRVNFVLVADNVELPLRSGPGTADILAGLGGAGGAGWPANALLYVGASAASTVSRADPLVARCPLVVALPGLEGRAEFLGAVAELLGYSGGAQGAHAVGGGVADADSDAGGDDAPVPDDGIASAAAAAAAAAVPVGCALPSDLAAAASAWGEQQGWSVRAAAEFVRSVAL